MARVFKSRKDFKMRIKKPDKGTGIYKFVGFLENCDKTILKLSPGKDFNFKILEKTEILRNEKSHGIAESLISELKGIPDFQKDEYLVLTKDIVYEEKDQDLDLYEVIGLDLSTDEDMDRWVKESPESDAQSIVRLLRLFKEGGINMPVWGYYHNGEISVLHLGRSRMANVRLFHVEDNEKKQINDLLQKTRLPFKDAILELAFESFDQSFFTFNFALKLISNVIALETLLNPSDSEVRYRVSRNLAILLGQGQKDSQEIFDNMKNLYAVRSKIVHGSNTGKVNGKDLMLSEHFAREAIKKFYSISRRKEDLLRTINAMGFESLRSW